MGVDQSKTRPTEDDIQKLSSITHFTPQEINMLWQKFYDLAMSQTADGLIDINEFQAALGLASQGFAKRLFSAFDLNCDQHIEFQEFCKGLSSLSPKASIHEKCEFCFSVYDIDKDGFIDRDELKEVLKYSLVENTGVHLDPVQLNKIIAATFRAMDKNGDNKISLDEFEAEAIRNKGILNCVNFSLESLIQ